jgi:hypothetical protein
MEGDAGVVCVCHSVDVSVCVVPQQPYYGLDGPIFEASRSYSDTQQSV